MVNSESFRNLMPRPLLIAFIAAAFLSVFWLQVINVPYWQDDYTYLLDARKARLEARSWLYPFLPETKVSFWRPLSTETYWRFVETFLSGNVRAAHLSNVLLLVLSASAVGWFVVTLLRLLAPERDAVLPGVVAAFLYGVHASHFLPVAWIAAANDSICVVFSALALRFWLVVSAAEKKNRVFAVAMLFLCLVMALLSRDVAFVLPVLGFLLTVWLWRHQKPSVTALTAGVFCAVVSLMWLMARQHFTMTADPAYELRFTGNVIRNAICLVLFFFNTPFEALRYFFLVGPSATFALWGVACFLLQATVLVMMRHALRGRWVGRDSIALASFFIVGCAPFFFLSRNCYPYYISIGLIAYAVLAGLFVQRGGLLPAVLLLAVASSSLSTLGNYFLDAPSHIGRAKWAERQLVRMKALHDAQPGLFSGPLHVMVEDRHKFLGFGVDGLAYRIGLDPGQIMVHGPEDSSATGGDALVVPCKGDVFLRSGKDGQGADAATKRFIE